MVTPRMHAHCGQRLFQFGQSHVTRQGEQTMKRFAHPAFYFAVSKGGVYAGRLRKTSTPAMATAVLPMAIIHMKGSRK